MALRGHSGEPTPRGRNGAPDKRVALIAAGALLLAGVAPLRQAVDADPAKSKPVPAQVSTAEIDDAVIKKAFVDRQSDRSLEPFPNRANGVAPGVQLPAGLAAANETPLQGGILFNSVDGTYRPAPTKSQQEG